MSRLENSAKNIVFSFGNTILASILGFISRTVFIHILGTDYLGLAGLLGNVLGFLSISELGIATAIGFSLYKPLAEKDYKVVSSLMSLYRKAYSIIGTIVLISGILLFFFLDFFIPVDQQPAGTDFAYFAFLANTVVSYFLAYKTTLISSDNQAFRLVPINMAVNTAQTILQILVLVLTRNYVVYLSVQIVCSIILMALQNIYITQKYSEVDFSSKDRLPSEKTVEIKRNVSGLIIAKIGDYLVNSTDNLIITKLVSLAATGIYSNYLLIRNMINGFIATLFSGITASMGNVVAVENDEKKLEIFDAVFFCAFLIYSIEATCFMSLYNLFIGDIWIGRNYIFSAGTVAVIVLNNYLTGLRIPLITMKGAAGKYLEDTWVPFGFAIVNLVASILLAKPFGVAGVFLGTIIGSLFTADWYRPFVIYRTVFHAPVKKYFRKYMVYLLLGVGYIALTYWLNAQIYLSNAYLLFLVRGIVSVGVPALLSCALFYRTTEFGAIKTLTIRLVRGTTARLRSKKKRIEMDSLASIIVPCYNGEKFVDRCFDSILKQKYAHMEVIVVNDGSTDQSEQRVLAWNDRFRNAGIQLVYVSQENKGPGGAINTGLKHVTGEYLCLLDIDDELLESAVSTRVAFLKSHPDIDVVRSNGWYNRKSGKSLFIYDEKEKRIDDVFSALVGGETNNWAGSYMVRTSALFDFYPDREIYQSRFGQNLQFLMPLTYKKKCGYIDEPQMIYNIQEDSLSKTSDIKKTEKILSDNLAGYRDIRIYLIEKIIKTPNESERYIRIVDIAYYRSLLKLAIDTRDEQLLKATYSNLKELSGVTINERIEYCQYFFPYMVFPLRCIRKIKTAIDTLRETL